MGLAYPLRESLKLRIFVMRHGIPDIPAVLEGIPSKAVITGMVVAHEDPTKWFPRPVPIGVSTGHPQITAGTIGCRVVDHSGNVYALSNNHVYANQNDAKKGDCALQPGAYDGGKTQLTVLDSWMIGRPLISQAAITTWMQQSPFHQQES
jgi:hypothetical protein